jgi:hypothetical protein
MMINVALYVEDNIFTLMKFWKASIILDILLGQHGYNIFWI